MTTDRRDDDIHEREAAEEEAEIEGEEVEYEREHRDVLDALDGAESDLGPSGEEGDVEEELEPDADASFEEDDRW